MAQTGTPSSEVGEKEEKRRKKRRGGKVSDRDRKEGEDPRRRWMC